MLIKKLLSVSILVMFFSSAFADNVDCISLSEGQKYEMNTNAPNFKNCFIVKDINQSSRMEVAVYSDDSTRSSITVNQVSSSGQLNSLAEYSSNSTGNIFFSTQAQNTTNGKLAFTIRNLTRVSENKNLSIDLKRINGITMMFVLISSVPNTSSSPVIPIDSGGATCNPNTGICMQPKMVTPVTSALSPNSSATQKCSGAEAPPPGLNKNFDLQAAGDRLFNLATLIDNNINLTQPEKETAKGLIFASLVMPYGKYDLKNNSNENFHSTYQGGDYSYGYLGAAMGYSLNTLLTAGAVVQTLSSSTPVEREIRMAGVLFGPPGSGDHVDDPPQERAGFNARKSNCNPNNSSSTTPTATSGGGSGGAGSGWDYSGFFIGLSGCYGNCNSQTEVTSIKDLPRQTQTSK